jgi:hypothetical protein
MWSDIMTNLAMIECLIGDFYWDWDGWMDGWVSELLLVMRPVLCAALRQQAQAKSSSSLPASQSAR